MVDLERAGLFCTTCVNFHAEKVLAGTSLRVGYRNVILRIIAIIRNAICCFDNVYGIKRLRYFFINKFVEIS